MKMMCWQYARVRAGLPNSDIEDAPRCIRPIEADKDTFKAIVDAKLANNTWDQREDGFINLKGLGSPSELDIWVPHVVTETKKTELFSEQPNKTSLPCTK